MKNNDQITINKSTYNALVHSHLQSEILRHPDCKDLNNIDHLIRYMIHELHYQWSDSKQAFCLHIASGDILIPDSRSVHAAIDSIAADPATAFLLASKKQVARYVRPRNNPWIRGDWFNLGVQGEVFRHDPDLARKWRHEALAVNARNPA